MTRPTERPRSLPEAGAGLAAYRAALGKVEPGEAFLARTRQALAAAEEDQGQQARAARRGARGVGRGPVWRGGFGRLPRLLLPAACCLLVLLAVPAAGLLRGGGQDLSGAAAVAEDEYSLYSAPQFAENTDGAPLPEAAPEDAPAEAPAAGVPSLGGAQSSTAERKQNGDADCDDALPEKDGLVGGTADAEVGIDVPAGGEFGGAGEGSEGFTPGEGDAPAAALAAFAAGEGWREGSQGGYDPAGLTLLRWERGSALLGGEAPEPVVRLWVAGPDGEAFAVDLPEG